MQSKEENGLVFIRLFPDEDFFQEVTRVCQKHRIETAVVLSGIGQLKQFELGFLKAKGDYAPQVFDEAQELLSLSGNVSNQQGEYNFHLHAVLGDEYKQAIGGHLIRAKVGVTNEIVLLKTNLKITRILEESSGLQGMFLEKQ